jgi:hypothetical protein
VCATALFHQVSVSACLHSVKIDPLRGHCRGQETPGEAAVRELYEESRGLFDFRHFNSDIEKLPQTLGIFHLKVKYEAMSSKDKITPLSLIEEYRNNRRGLQGCEEILDLAMEPKSRIDNPQRYPRLSVHMKGILSDLNFNIDEVPCVPLIKKKVGGLTTYSVDSCKGDVDIVSLIPKADRKRYHPLLLDGPQWERWVIEHDRNRAVKSKYQCFVSQNDSSFEFSYRKPDIYRVSCQ